MNDIIGNVKTPTPPLPDLNKSEICSKIFEEINAKKHVYHTDLVMKWFRYLENELYEFLCLDKSKQYWNLDLDYLVDLI